MNYTQRCKHTATTARSLWLFNRKKRGLRKDVKVGDIIENCSLHLARVISVDNRSGDIVTISLFKGHEGSCDLYHCGVVVQTTKQIIQKMEMFKTGGMPAINAFWQKRILLGVY